MQDRPYFMENKEWYEYDFKKRRFVLTSKATKEAKKSLENFYKGIEHEYGTNNEEVDI